MDEVDNIIVHSLLQIGCDVENTKLSEFTPDIVVKSVSKCLSLIEPDINVPKVLPPGMAQRFTATATLAEACVSLGFRGDIGYQTFLYSNTAEVRRVFMFLIERLPKESDKSVIAENVTDSYTQLEQKIINSMLLQSQTPWIPEFCNPNRLREKSLDMGICSPYKYPGKYLQIPEATRLENVTDEQRNYWKNILPPIYEQNSRKFLISSLIHTNDMQLLNPEIMKNPNMEQITISNKKYSNKLNLNPKMTDEDTIPPNQQIESTSAEAQQTVLVLDSPTTKINNELEDLKKMIEHTEAHNVTLESRLETLKLDAASNKDALKTLKTEKKVHERIKILLQNPSENIQKIETIIAATLEKSKTMAVQWKEHEMMLNDALNVAKSKHSKEYEYLRELNDKIIDTQNKCQELKEDSKKKKVHHAQLVAELEKANKKINRKSYTSRILEIIGNIKKQRAIINNILIDTKSLQKEIYTITGQLERQFTATDDLIYRSAKRNDNSRKAYKFLVTMHSDFEEIIKSLQDVGTTMRDIRDLDDQIETIKGRNVMTNLEKITEDIAAMENESKSIELKIVELRKKDSDEA